jgi:hypothetical protein
MDISSVLSSFPPYDSFDRSSRRIYDVPAIFLILSFCEIAKIFVLAAIIYTLSYLLIRIRVDPKIDPSLQITILILAIILVLTSAMHIKLWRMKLGIHVTQHFKIFVSVIFSCDTLLSALAILMVVTKSSQNENIWVLTEGPLTEQLEIIPRRAATFSKVSRKMHIPWQILNFSQLVCITGFSVLTIASSISWSVCCLGQSIILSLRWRNDESDQA